MTTQGGGFVDVDKVRTVPRVPPLQPVVAPAPTPVPVIGNDAAQGGSRDVSAPLIVEAPAPAPEGLTDGQERARPRGFEAPPDTPDEGLQELAGYDLGGRRYDLARYLADNPTNEAGLSLLGFDDTAIAAAREEAEAGPDDVEAAPRHIPDVQVMESAPPAGPAPDRVRTIAALEPPRVRALSALELPAVPRALPLPRVRTR